MSNTDSLHDRGAALENQFFANLDAKLLEELKIRQDHDNQIAEFARITGIQDTSILDGLLRLGVTSQSFAALRVFPLVAVAWADGTIEESERLTVNSIASTHFLLKQCPAGKLLDAWLSTKPSSDMFDSWEKYASVLASALPAHDADELKNAIVKEIHTVATASGGLLGWSAVSSGESKVLKRIEAALTRP
jgi:uncharacterized tellurite resistance protein B-like protein